MSIVVKHCDELLSKHHRKVSPIVLSAYVIAVFGFIAPTILFAAELTMITSTPAGPKVPEEFRPERKYEFNNVGRFTSTTVGQLEKERAEAMKQVMQEFKNKRVMTLKEKLLQLETAARDLRLKLEELQSSNPSSTPQVSIEAINKELNDLILVFKKTNVVNEIPRLKAEVKKEFDLRKAALKKEMEVNREAAKKQFEADREAAKKLEEARREALKKQAEGDGDDWRPVSPVPPSTSVNATQ